MHKQTSPVLAVAIAILAVSGCNRYVTQRKASSWEQGAPGSAYRIPSLFTVKRNFHSQSESDFLTVNLETYRFREDREADPVSDADRARLRAAKDSLERLKAAVEAAANDHGKGSDEHEQAHTAFTTQSQTYAALLRTSGARTAYERASQSREDRNRLIGDLMHLSERIAVVHLSAILSLEDGWEVSLGTTRNTLAGLAAILEPSGTTSALAGGAALAGATGDLLRSEVYGKTFATAIVRECDDERADQRLLIEARLSKSVEDYPIDLALVDVAEYHKRGSFWHGLSRVVERANTPDELIALKAEAKRNAKLAELRIKKMQTDVAFDKLRRTLSQDVINSAKKELDAIVLETDDARSRTATIESIEVLIKQLDEFMTKLESPDAPATTPSS